MKRQLQILKIRLQEADKHLLAGSTVFAIHDETEGQFYVSAFESKALAVKHVDYLNWILGAKAGESFLAKMERDTGAKIFIDGLPFVIAEE